MLRISDNVDQVNIDAISDSITVESNVMKTDGMSAKAIWPVTIQKNEQEESDDARTRQDVTLISIEETAADEGWQEANPKGRSGNAGGRKSNRRRPVLTKLQVSGSDCSNVNTSSSSGREKASPARKLGLSAHVIDLHSPLKQQVKARASRGEDSITSVQGKNQFPIAKILTSPAALASRSLSYKQVALAPPGTVLKPLLEKDVEEEHNSTKVEVQVPGILPLEKMSEEDSDANNSDSTVKHEVEEKEQATSMSTPENNEIPVLASNEEKAKETNGSKLSAAAEPFQPLNSITVTGICDAPTGVPPVASRVPCGPRSPLYCRKSHDFRMTSGFRKYQTPRIMNPHAPEFIPRKVLHADLEA